MRSKVALLILPLLLLPGTAGAVDFSGLDLDPLLRVRIQQTTPAQPPAVEDIHKMSDFFVTRGGATTLVRVFQLIGTQSRRTLHQLGRGISAPDPLTHLKQVLNTARAGLQSNCTVIEDSPVNTYEITWYGRNARQNLFTVVFGPLGSSALPSCPPEVSELIRTIVDYESQILNDPESEVLTNE